MKYYLANGVYVGTQAEAKKADPNYETAEVPQDKEGLMGYLNGLVSNRVDVEVALLDPQPPPPEPLKPSYTAVSIAIDDAWDELPLLRKLSLASGVLEEAHAYICGPLGKVSKMELKT